MLKIKYISIEEITEDKYSLLREAVSDERGKKADRYRFMDDSKRSILAELLLQYSLYQVFGEKVELTITYNKFGKPFLANKESFLYNLSHSGKWVVIAYGNSEVGVDIEEVRECRDNVAERVFTEEEKKYLCTEDERGKAKRFTQIWSLKESYIKYLGTGLSTSLTSFTVNPLEGVVVTPDGEREHGVMLKSYFIEEEYYLSACTTEKEVEVERIQVDDILRYLERIK